MSHITRGITRNLSCAIRQRERRYLEGRERERGRKRGETQNGLFHNRLTDLLALSSRATLTENQGEKGKRMLRSFPPISHSLIYPVCLSRPSSFLLLLSIGLYPAFLKNPLSPCTPSIVPPFTQYRSLMFQHLAHDHLIRLQLFGGPSELIAPTDS